MTSTSAGVPSLSRVEAIFVNPALYELASVVPKHKQRSGGRPRTHPDYMLLGFEALVSVYGSARRVEAELSHPLVWSYIRWLTSERFPTRPEMHLPPEPMRRHHYSYGRNRYLSDPRVLRRLSALHRRIAASQAREIGLLDPAGKGSWTHPDPDRLLHADGKVLTPLFKAKPGDARVDKSTGELVALRAEADAGLHFEGTGEAAWGTKFVLVAARSEDPHGRIVLDVEWVPSPGGEARSAMACFERLAPLVPGAQGIVYDTALRGVHHQKLLRDLGLHSINRVAAAEAGASEPRRGKGRRVAKSVHVEDKNVRLPDGTTVGVRLYARDGALGIGELTERGEMAFEPLRRLRTHRIKDDWGKFRWYNDYQLPESYGAGVLTVRLHGTDEDRARRLNRPENLRPIPASDPDFVRLYARRNDAESINRGVEDSMYLGRAHSLGHARQHVNLLGYALMVNSVALLLARNRAGPEATAA